MIRPSSIPTATFARIPASAISAPRLPRAGPAHVTTCDALWKMIRRVTLSTWNGNRQAVTRGRVAGNIVAGIGVAQNPRRGIIRKHALDALAHLWRSVGNDDLTSVQ